MTSESQFSLPINLAPLPGQGMLGPFPLAQTASHNAPPQAPLSVLKVCNVPADLTAREAYLIFALVQNDVSSVELADGTITAHFKNPNTCIATGNLLDGRFLFGAAHGPLKTECDPTTLATAAFDSLRLSNSAISPPTPHQAPPNLPLQSGSQINQTPPGYDFPKRASVGNQRSRFLFSDPFSGSTTPTGNAPGDIDLSDLTGKSLFLMKPQESREFESIPRDPWSQAQGNLGFSLTPQTPGLASVHYDWSHSNLAAPLSQTHNQSQQGTPMTLISSDRRRTSSFFDGAQQSSNGVMPPSSAIQQQPKPQSEESLVQSTNIAPTHAPAPTVASVISQGPSGNGTLSSMMPATASRNSSSPASGTPPTTSSARNNSKDIPDLSLLARVPPPANPADQNPPCNTLYVGNLPPDATEAELRSLFSPQKGFRRLSFRTKNQSSNSSLGTTSHNHGPMCFVEFEDVAHATIALAELYGRALPRPNGSNGKGGIRLSFSKNPLGVRGPGNTRRASTQPTLNGNTNSVGNYGYLSFH